MAIEPAIGMREMFYEEPYKRRLDWVTRDERIWEVDPYLQRCFLSSIPEVSVFHRG